MELKNFTALGFGLPSTRSCPTLTRKRNRHHARSGCGRGWAYPRIALGTPVSGPAGIEIPVKMRRFGNRRSAVATKGSGRMQMRRRVFLV